MSNDMLADVYRQIEATGGVPARRGRMGVAGVYVATNEVLPEVMQALEGLNNARAVFLDHMHAQGIKATFQDADDPWHHIIDTLEPVDKAKPCPAAIQYAGRKQGKDTWWWNLLTDEGRYCEEHWGDRVDNHWWLAVEEGDDAYDLMTNKGGLPFIISFNDENYFPGWVRIPLSYYHAALGD